MKALRNYLDKIKPNFEEGGKFHAFQSVFDGFETFLFVPSKTAFPCSTDYRYGICSAKRNPGDTSYLK